MLTRRRLLRGIAGGLGVAAGACGGSSDDDDEEGDPADPSRKTGSNGRDGGTDPNAPDPIYSQKELLAGIDHIVVLMMENRSFDHYLGSLKSDAGYAAAAQVEGLTGNETNPGSSGEVKVFRMDNFEPADPPHDWDPVHFQWNNGKNDQFIASNEGPFENQVMGFHDRSQLAFYYWLADNFTICDHWFSSVLGPTWVNRYYLHSTTSLGKKDNTPIGADFPPTIWDLLQEKGLTYKNYAAGNLPWYLGGFVFKAPSLNPTAPIDQFFDALRNETLPAFSLIDPDFSANDDHPSHNIQLGQAFIASVYKALAQSRLWSKSLLIITYDEHGGFYDHVPPPPVNDDNPEFAQLGFRVPAFVIGPTVKRGYVCKKVLEHSSVAATLRTRWDVRNLTTRMTNASDIGDCIDPKKVAHPAAAPPGAPMMVMRREDVLRDSVGVSSQPLLEEMARDGRITPLDRRSHGDRIGAWLEHAARLGAIRIV